MLKTASDLSRKNCSFLYCSHPLSRAVALSLVLVWYGNTKGQRWQGMVTSHVSLAVLHNNFLQAWRTKGMCCSPPLSSLFTYCLLYPSACTFNITLIKEVWDQLREEKWYGLPGASGAVIMHRPTMGPVFFQLMIKYLAHKYQYYVILKSSQQIVTICERLCLGRFETSKVSLRNRAGFSSRAGESSNSDLILQVSSARHLLSWV